MRKSICAIALATLATTSTSAAVPPRELQSPLSPPAPARASAGVEVADEAIRALQQRLSGRLQEELQKGGPVGALSVCRDEAQALTAEIARGRGLRLGRTSHRLRNPGNTAPSWAQGFVEAGAGKKAASVEGAVVDLGDRVGVLRPVATAAPCTQCHGRTEKVSPEVAAFLATAYPEDRATGFEEGDLRGFIWVEAPKSAGASAPVAASTQGVADPEKGKQVFGAANPRCIICHRVEGKGNTQGPLDGVGKRLSRDEIKAWIRTPAEMAKKLGKTRKPPMLPYPKFSDEELEALVAYLMSLEPSPEHD
jgi:mono/diheme cytochrome c family protein